MSAKGTILDNIRFGSEVLTDEDVRRAARQIGLEAMMECLPEGLETWVHERGDNLSTGQKQMIAFARALAHDPVYLLLDEATSNIDLVNRMDQPHHGGLRVLAAAESFLGEVKLNLIH